MAAELSGQLTDAQKARFERMKVRLDELLKLIQMWLRMASVDFDKIQEKFSAVSIGDVLAGAAESLQPYAARKAIEIAVPKLEEPLSVWGDEGSLKEAVLNVVGNAIKYSPPAKAIRVGARRAGDEVVITVADSGIGIAAADLPHIFEDFYRGSLGKSGEGGCGLGLSITRRIIEAHHGSISVQSEPGRGTKFVIELPANSSHDRAQ